MTKSLLAATPRKSSLHANEKERGEKGSGTSTFMPETDWHSIYVASILSFVGTVQFSLFFSSLWPYVQIIDRSINETHFGWIIAIYSVGQIISAPVFGWWSNRIRQVRTPLYVGLTMMLLGNMCYLSLEMSSISKLYILLFCRFVTGMGSGNVCLLRTYASTASTSKDRFRAIAYVTCGQALGSTGGPAFQLLFTSFNYPGFTLFGTLRFNLYTAPAFLACLMNVFGAIILRLLFKEQYAGLEEVKVPQIVVEKGSMGEENGTPAEEKAMVQPKLPPYDLIACFICYLSRFTQMFTQTNLETIGSPLAMTMFGWSEATAVEITSIAQGLIGGITFAIYIVYINLKSSKTDLNFRLSCMLSLAGLAAFHLITFSWPFLTTPVPMYNESQRASFQLSDSDPPPVGCNTDRFTWCQSLAQVNVWVYYIAYVFFIGLAFPVLNIAMNTLFSHILGPRRQGTQQGFFQMAGSIARLVGPILMSTLYSLYGPRMAWIMELVVIGCTSLLWLLFYSRMVPLLSPERKFAKNIRMTVTSVDGSTKTLTRPDVVGHCQQAKSKNVKKAVGKSLSLPVEDRCGKLSITH